MLDCPRNGPLLRLEQTQRSAAGLPVLLSQEHYAPGVFSLTVQRRRRDHTTLTGRRAQEH